MKRTSLIVSLTSILVVVAVAAGFLVAGARPQLGLDLQGGVHFTMQVDQKAALDKQIDENLRRVYQEDSGEQVPDHLLALLQKLREQE